MANEKVQKRPEDRVTDEASLKALKKAISEDVSTCFGRMDEQANQCSFGKSGLCCRVCHMGPCRITPKSPRGVCGANADTIVARNYLREVASGAAAHADHARHIVFLLKRVAKGEGGDYKIKDEGALLRAARQFGIPCEGRTNEDIALDLADFFIGEFSRQEGVLATLALAPLNRRGIWKKQDVEPCGIDRSIVECLHRTNIGVDHDHQSILMHAMRTSLSDGWGGSRIASIAGDILFGTPSPVRSSVNLGVLGEKTVNIVVHGHEPSISEMLAQASTDPEIKALAHAAGADGVTLAGICCTANEILMRHGIPIAGNFLQQELAIVTGAVEMMIVDVQCCMPSLPDIAKLYHTEIVSTSSMARTLGAHHVSFEKNTGLESAKNLLKRAIDNYKRRDPRKVAVPDCQRELVAGFSVHAIRHMLGGYFRNSFRPLNDAIIDGRILGVCGIVGCSNPKSKMDDYTLALTRELIRQNVLILKTGCAAIASAKEGMLTPETALELAGPGLREVCEAVGIPPILHMGSCVDNSRILEAAAEIVAEGGLGDDLSDVPAVGVAPEWMSEKAIAIGTYFVASGIDVILGHPFYITGSENVTGFMNAELKSFFGASFHVHADPGGAASKVIEILNMRRKKLGINKKAERKLMDMKDRRELEECQR